MNVPRLPPGAANHVQRRRIYSRLAQPARGTALPRIVNAIRLMLEAIAYGQLTSRRPAVAMSR
ncbi:hypothetical protein [Rhizobium laguerreae]|uniref:hypothetical protein n=1 Tax=Rhizobium laguerreae TaxID=1076926 RepID=UPI0014429872|nr:hypothetical protein [Rhizobium laguerreae]NKM31843.1 hypothetical protein [Rhizobium laguerreae]